MPAQHVLDEQLDRLVALGYPDLAGLSERGLRALADGLTPPPVLPSADGRSGHVPALLVVAGHVVPPERAVPLLHLDGSSRPGILDRNHGEQGLRPYRPIDAVAVPDAPMYLLLDVQRGDEYRGAAPRDALPQVLERGRTPLTIPEGVALVTQAPGLLARNHGFSLAGSRRGDRRVPALWVSSGAPKLGWCWDGNPHDWLGLASAGARVA